MNQEAIQILAQRLKLARIYWESKRSRMTLVRSIICQTIFKNILHFNADQILKDARAQDSAISLTSVYRTIKALKSAQLIEEILFKGKKGTYRLVPIGEASSSSIICKNCSQIIELDDPCLPIREGARIAEKGFKTHSVKLETLASCEEFESSGTCKRREPKAAND